jgi:glycosyltransferase involved in cell wall biosynthesis
VLPHIPPLVSEVILVDGHSADETVATARQLLPTIRVIEQEGRGKGNALRLGFAASSGDIIVMLDADGSTDPREIPRFIAALMQGHDFAKGSRFSKGGGSDDNTLLRYLGNCGLSKLASVLFKARFSDLFYGYNAFWRHCLDYVTIDHDGFEGETLIWIRLHQLGFEITEVASFEHRRIHGASKLHAFRDGWQELKMIVREWRRKSSLSQQLPRSTTSLSMRPQPSVEEIVL